MTDVIAFRHPDAFRLLRYRCESCGFVEVVWNSRDGGVPDVIECARAEVLLPRDWRSANPSVRYGLNEDALRACSTTHVLRAIRVPVDIPAPCQSIAPRVLRGVSYEFLGLSGDYFSPSHDPLPGDRYFRDGIPAEARAMARQRLTKLRSRLAMESKIADEDINAWIRFQECDQSVGSEFAPGWPMLVVRGSDADGLPRREPFQVPPIPTDPGAIHMSKVPTPEEETG